MARKVKLAEMTWVEVKAALESGTDTVIVPLGSVEQHSRHLPLITDSANVEWIAGKAAEGTDGVLVAPTVVYGISHNHIDFAGTVTLRTSTLIALLKDIAHSLVKHGFRNIVFLNGHGGNNAAVAVAAIELREETGATIANIYTPNLMRNSAKVLESDIEWHGEAVETLIGVIAELREAAREAAGASNPS